MGNNLPQCIVPASDLKHEEQKGSIASFFKPLAATVKREVKAEPQTSEVCRPTLVSITVLKKTEFPCVRP